MGASLNDSCKPFSTWKTCINKQKGQEKSLYQNHVKSYRIRNCKYHFIELDNSLMKKKKIATTTTKHKNNKRQKRQPCMIVEMCYTDQKSKRGTSNLLNEIIYSIVVFKIDLFFVLLKGELTKTLLKIQNHLDLKYCCRCSECCLDEFQSTFIKDSEAFRISYTFVQIAPLNYSEWEV